MSPPNSAATAAAASRAAPPKRKYTIQPIRDERSRQVTFVKRKGGLLRKAYELSVLCGCEVGVVVFSKSGRLTTFASDGDLDSVLLRFVDVAVPHETRSNLDFLIEDGHLPPGSTLDDAKNAFIDQPGADDQTAPLAATTATAAAPASIPSVAIHMQGLPQDPTTPRAPAPPTAPDAAHPATTDPASRPLLMHPMPPGAYPAPPGWYGQGAPPAPFMHPAYDGHAAAAAAAAASAAAARPYSEPTLPPTTAPGSADARQADASARPETTGPESTVPFSAAPPFPAAPMDPAVAGYPPRYPGYGVMPPPPVPMHPYAAAHYHYPRYAMRPDYYAPYPHLSMEYPPVPLAGAHAARSRPGTHSRPSPPPPSAPATTAGYTAAQPDPAGAAAPESTTPVPAIAPGAAAPAVGMVTTTTTAAALTPSSGGATPPGTKREWDGTDEVAHPPAKRVATGTDHALVESSQGTSFSPSSVALAHQAAAVLTSMPGSVQATVTTAPAASGPPSALAVPEAAAPVHLPPISVPVDHAGAPPREWPGH